jgi:hypothetical protein
VVVNAKESKASFRNPRPENPRKAGLGLRFHWADLGSFFLHIAGDSVVDDPHSGRITQLADVIQERGHSSPGKIR